MKQFRSIWLVPIAIVLLSSCLSPKSMIYLQDKGYSKYDVIESQARVITEKYKIQTNDYLYVRVVTSNPELSRYYNMGGNAGGASTEQMGQGNNRMTSYLVDDNGEIDVPTLGKVFVRGLNRSEVKQKITGLLNSQIAEFTLFVELSNAYFTILGEANAGLYQMPKDQLTIYEAIAISGDLTMYSKRKKVKIIRPTISGVSEIRTVNLTDLSLLDSENSYIYPNDMIYVEPVKAKMLGLGDTFSVGILTSLIGLYFMFKSF